MLYASIHQASIFPGGGALAGPRLGTGIRLHDQLARCHAGSDGASWLSLLEHVVLPAATVFRPELVLISAGFDAHRDDPLADCRLDSDDFARMACHVRGASARPWGLCWRGAITCPLSPPV